MMVGSLVHIPHARFYSVLQKILSGFFSPCVLLLTIKEGEGMIRLQDGRIFYLWNDNVLKDIFASLNLETASFFRSESVIGSKEPWQGYVLKK